MGETYRDRELERWHKGRDSWTANRFDSKAAQQAKHNSLTHERCPGDEEDPHLFDSSRSSGFFCANFSARESPRQRPVHRDRSVRSPATMGEYT